MFRLARMPAAFAAAMPGTSVLTGIRGDIGLHEAHAVLGAVDVRGAAIAGQDEGIAQAAARAARAF